MSQPGYLHGPLQMWGPENGVCNYLELGKINGMLILRIRAFSPLELCCLLNNDLQRGTHGHPRTPSPSLASPLKTLRKPLHSTQLLKWKKSKWIFRNCRGFSFSSFKNKSRAT